MAGVLLLKARTPDIYREAINLFERALALDPQSVEARSRLAHSLVSRVLDGMADSAATDLARAEGLVERALAASPRYAPAHFVKGHLLRAQNRWGEAIPEYEMVLASNRNSAVALSRLGWCKLYVGSIEEVIPLVERAIRLSPRDPGIGSFYQLIGTVHLLLSCTDEAIVWLEKTRSAMPTVPMNRSRLAPAESPIANLFEPVSGPPSCAVDRGPTRFSRRTALRRRQKRGTGALAPSRESDQWTELDVDWCRRIN